MRQNEFICVVIFRPTKYKFHYCSVCSELYYFFLAPLTRHSAVPAAMVIYRKRREIKTMSGVSTRRPDRECSDTTDDSKSRYGRGHAIGETISSSSSNLCSILVCNSGSGDGGQQQVKATHVDTGHACSSIRMNDSSLYMSCDTSFS